MLGPITILGLYSFCLFISLKGTLSLFSTPPSMECLTGNAVQYSHLYWHFCDSTVSPFKEFVQSFFGRWLVAQTQILLILTPMKLGPGLDWQHGFCGWGVELNTRNKKVVRARINWGAKKTMKGDRSMILRCHITWSFWKEWTMEQQGKLKRWHRSLVSNFLIRSAG